MAGAVKSIRGLIHEPLTHEECVIRVKPVVLVDLQQRARNCQIIAARRPILQRAWVLPHPKQLVAVPGYVQTTEPTLGRGRPTLRRQIRGRRTSYTEAICGSSRCAACLSPCGANHEWQQQNRCRCKENEVSTRSRSHESLRHTLLPSEKQQWPVPVEKSRTKWPLFPVKTGDRPLWRIG